MLRMKNQKSVRAGRKSRETKERDKATRHRDYARRFEEAEKNENWAVTMSKVRIRQAVARAPWPRWHLLTFAGPEDSFDRIGFPDGPAPA
jgi:hypothetical protein